MKEMLADLAKQKVALSYLAPFHIHFIVNMAMNKHLNKQSIQLKRKIGHVS